MLSQSPAVFFRSGNGDADEKEALLVLCSNELAQLYTIVAADKVRHQPLLCFHAAEAAAAVMPIPLHAEHCCNHANIPSVAVHVLSCPCMS